MLCNIMRVQCSSFSFGVDIGCIIANVGMNPANISFSFSIIFKVDETGLTFSFPLRQFIDRWIQQVHDGLINFQQFFETFRSILICCEWQTVAGQRIISCEVEQCLLIQFLHQIYSIRFIILFFANIKFVILSIDSSLCHRSPMNIKSDSSNVNKICQIYSSLQSNQSYQGHITACKKMILADDIPTIMLTIHVIKNTLSYSDLYSIQDICTVECISLKRISSEYQNISLNQYSKLLAVRLLREVYFQAKYSFIIVANLYLQQIFKKIALYGSASPNQQKATMLFLQGRDQVFNKIGSQNKAKTTVEDLKLIGFSLHKFIIQILQMSNYVFKLLPFHEQFCRIDFNKFSPFFSNPFRKILQSLPKSSSVIPSRFYYFKMDDRVNYLKNYSTIEGAHAVRQFYAVLFDKAWCWANPFREHTERISIRQRLEGFNDKNSGDWLWMQICTRIADETNDRYFWGYLHLFLKDRFQEIDHLTKEDKFSQIAIVSCQKMIYFITALFQIISSPELVLFMSEHLFLSSLQQIYLRWLRICCDQIIQLDRSDRKPIVRVGQQEGNKQASANNNRSLLGLFINLYTLLEYLSRALQTQIKMPQYVTLSKYFQLLLSHIPCFQGLQTYQSYSQLLINTVKNRLKISSKIVNSKLQFLQVYLNPSGSVRVIQQQFGCLEQQLLQIKQRYCTTEFITVKNNQVQEYNLDIVLQSQEALRDQIQSVNSDFKLKFNAPSQYSRFKPNLSRKSQFSFRSLPKDSGKQSDYSSSAPKNEDKCSFMNQLRLRQNINPNKHILRSLSKRKQSSSQYKSSRELSAIFDFFKNSMQYGSHQKEHSESQRNDSEHESSQHLLSFREAINFGHEVIDLQNKSKGYNSDYSDKQSRLKASSPVIKLKQTDTIALHSNSNGSRPLVTPQRLKKRKMPTHTDQQELNINLEQLIPLNLHLSEKYRTKNSPTPSPIQQQSKYMPEQLCFYFLPKMKRQLLKSKVLVARTKHAEIGMITSLPGYQSNQSTRGKIQIYVTALVQLQRVSVNIKCPSWLKCLYKNNHCKQQMAKTSQSVATFRVILRHENQIERNNYGDLPILNLVYFNEQHKYTLSQSLPYLITKFCIEQPTSQSQIESIIKDKQFQAGIKVHHKLINKVEDIIHYYPQSVIKPGISHNFETPLKNSINKSILAVSKLVYCPLKLPLFLFFFEKSSSTCNEYDLSQQRDIFIQIFQQKQPRQRYEQLHVLKTCLRSIFTH